MDIIKAILVVGLWSTVASANTLNKDVSVSADIVVKGGSAPLNAAFENSFNSLVYDAVNKRFADLLVPLVIRTSTEPTMTYDVKLSEAYAECESKPFGFTSKIDNFSFVKGEKVADFTFQKISGTDGESKHLIRLEFGMVQQIVKSQSCQGFIGVIVGNNI